MNQDERDRLEGKRVRLRATRQQVQKELDCVQQELDSVTADVKPIEGLTPELQDRVLSLRQGMNERVISPEHRLLLLPPGTGFKGDRLLGFDVRVVNEPIALCGDDFPQGQTFVIQRSDLKRLDPSAVIWPPMLSEAGTTPLTGADWNALVDHVENREHRRERRRAA